MKPRFTVIAVFLSVMIPAICLGNGMFYSSNIRLELPYQRAVVVFNGSEEILLLQSAFSGVVEEFGWVVPIPKVPRLASLEEFAADDLFRSLYRLTRPGRNNLYEWTGAAFLGAVVIFGVILSLRGQGAAPGCAAVGLVVLMAVAIPQFGGRHDGVQVISEEQVGVFAVKVIKGEDSRAIMAWLKEHNFHFSEKDESVFQQYVDRDWCFVTARITKESAVSSSGMVNPLIFRFPTKEPQFPLALTGTVSTTSDVVLYIFSEYKLKTDSHLEIIYAGEEKEEYSKIIDLIGNAYEPGNDIRRAFAECGYLNKFEAGLTPDRMKNDPVFTRADDAYPYRKVIMAGAQQGLLFAALSLILLLLYLAQYLSLRSRKRRKKNQ